MNAIGTPGGDEGPLLGLVAPEPGGPEVSVPVLLDLPSDSLAPGRARGAVRDALLSWRLPALVDSAVLVVSELVTNAVRYGRPPLRLAVRRHHAQVRLDVHDGEAREPSVGEQRDVFDESGRGLSIVAALAQEVGVEQVPGDGKIVHATLAATPEDPSLS